MVRRRVSVLRRRTTATCFAALTACLAVVGCAGSDAADNGEGETLNVVTVIPNHLPFIVVEAAERLGTWEDSGLNVNVIDGSSPTAGQIMATGEADIGLVDGNRAVANIAEGLEAQIVGSNYSPWAQLYAVHADHPADNVEDLKGANFGISGEGSAGHYAVYKLAEEMGWSEDDYDITALGDIQSISAALESRSIDGFAWSSTSVFDLEEQGVAKTVGAAEEFVGPNVFESFTVMNDALERNSEAVNLFFEEYYETVEELQADPQIAVDIMVEDWDVNPTAAERSVERELEHLSTGGPISDDELAGAAEAGEFMVDTPIDPQDIYTDWNSLG